MYGHAHSYRKAGDRRPRSRLRYLFPFEDFPPDMIWVMGTVISEALAKRGGAVFRIALDDDRFKYVEQEGGNWKWPPI